jgi:hypothetical protein
MYTQGTNYQTTGATTTTNYTTQQYQYQYQLPTTTQTTTTTQQYVTQQPVTTTTTQYEQFVQQPTTTTTTTQYEQFVQQPTTTTTTTQYEQFVQQPTTTTTTTQQFFTQPVTTTQYTTSQPVTYTQQFTSAQPDYSQGFTQQQVTYTTSATPAYGSAIMGPPIKPQPAIKLLRQGSGISPNEQRGIISTAVAVYQSGITPVSNNTASRIKKTLGGDWLVIVYTQGKPIDFNMTCVQGNDYMYFTLDNVAYQVCRLR